MTRLTTRAGRLRALEADPSAFASTALREAGRGRRRDRIRGAAWFMAMPDQPADPVAVALIRPLPADENVDHEINAMWVVPELRGQRIGEALLDAALATMPDGRAVRLWVTAGNDGAVALYTRRGFRPTGRAESLRSGSQLSVAEYLLTIG